MKIKRRDFVKILLASAISAALGVAVRALPKSKVVRPPGALVEEEFLSRCLRCGLCVENCLTGTLTPCTLEDGLAIWGTPKVDPLRAPCEAVAGRCEKYRPCVESCPTSALVFLESSRVKLGSVVWVKENCIAYRGGYCLVCDEVCPVEGAITVRRGVPVFHEDRCVGCGRCVYACPADPKALYLTPKGEVRVEIG